MKSIGNRRAGFPGERHAIGHRRTFDWHERYHVDGAEPRMLALVGAQVDIGDRALEERHDGALDPGGVADQREDGPVVRRVRRVIEETHARHPPDGAGHRGDHVRAASLADVGNALNQH